MTPFYYSAPVYDAMVDESKRKDIAFWKRAVRPVKGAVLELFCGTGQIARALAVRGRRVTGVDCSAELIRVARLKSRHAAQPVMYHEQNVLSLDLAPEQFAFIFAPMGSLGHLTSTAGLKKFFKRVRQHLLPGGTFAFDVPYPDLMSLMRDKNQRLLVGRYPEKKGGREVVVEETGVYDPVRQIHHLLWYQSFSDGTLGQMARMDIKIFFPTEIRWMLESNGLEQVRCYGDYNGSPLRATSPRQIVFCRLK